MVEAAVSEARPDAERHIARLSALRQELGVLAAATRPDRTAIDRKLVEISGGADGDGGGLAGDRVDSLLGLPAPARAALLKEPETSED